MRSTSRSTVLRDLPGPRAAGRERPLARPDARPLLGVDRAGGLQAWMLVLPLDAVLTAAPMAWSPHYWKAFAALSVIFVALVCGGGRYRARLHLSVLDELPGLLGRLLVAIALVAAVFAVRHDNVGVTEFVLTSLASVALVVAGRAVSTGVVLTGRRRRIVAHRTVLVGGGDLSGEVAALLDRYPRYGLAVAGYVDSAPGPASARVPWLGTLDDLDDLVAALGADVLLVGDGAFDEADLLDRVRTPATQACDLLVVPRLHAFATATGHTDHIGSLPVMRIRTPALDGPARALKRAVDVAVSSLALLVLSPVFLACALAVRIEGGPGILFRQIRVGRDGRRFECLKFRSMRPATTAEGDTQWSIAQDDRVGPVGRVLRATSLDELPQLVNILRGEMTVVGPRPERPHFVEQFSAEHPRYGHRHRVPAGLTGLAQVSGLRGDTPISDRARVDNYYIENWSLWLDLKVLLRTVSEVLLAKGR
ncbi:sugar transferase [Actinomycetospora chiangmaiensis]|uniref:sugar transferase n=1 Tax=Actinomycetospora chiangmaiensis TaxID=402650 RepID=UPI0003737172|nr:sugar transferase [Actinomycetospora chiangmaiensis]